ncbi:MAG: hypothetical protein Q7S58_20145 [Candidatus Binatus sp.]|uniref:hypothetical protein n=1 Tax=Candidatus Binatus sp. TaxID=2811406 RepID=UPI0027262537|nr:hypothetical protein [Candidatus Binatus sp.]MDO8434715.1 hypothetical protein [Candidatus Binatus sp.]
MKFSPASEIHFLLDSSGALIVFQEKDASWAGVLGFTTEENAREFCRVSNLDAAEIASISVGDPEAIAALIKSVKNRAVRNLLLDLDYKTGACTQVEFDGDRFGEAAARQMTPPARH